MSVNILGFIVVNLIFVLLLRFFLWCIRDGFLFFDYGYMETVKDDQDIVETVYYCIEPSEGVKKDD